jgi:hypothetical protein
MSSRERINWVALVVLPVATLVYLAVVVSRATDAPVTEISWVTPMLWCIASIPLAMIVGSIVLSIVTKDVPGRADVRDLEIYRLGQTIELHVISLGTMVTIVLCMMRVDPFWTASSVFVIGVLSASIGSVAKIRAYRRGF